MLDVLAVQCRARFRTRRLPTCTRDGVDRTAAILSISESRRPSRKHLAEPSRTVRRQFARGTMSEERDERAILVLSYKCHLKKSS